MKYLCLNIIIQNIYDENFQYFNPWADHAIISIDDNFLYFLWKVSSYIQECH